MSIPASTGYALTDDGFHIGYRAWGHGDLVHMFRPEFAASIEGIVRHPAHIRFNRFVGSLGRCVSFDPRGIGVSDPVENDRVGDLSDWMNDAIAVLDAIGAEQVTFIGEGYSAQLGIILQQTFPERILRLLLLNGHARVLVADDYAPAGAYPSEFLNTITANVLAEWGTGTIAAAFSPALATDPSFIEILGHTERLACSPSTAAAMVRRIAAADIRAILPLVSVPTLVYHTDDLNYVSSEMSRYVADHVPDASFIEAPGKSFYEPEEVGNLEAWAKFIVGGEPPTLDRRLASILFVDVVGSTQHAAVIGDERWAAKLEDLDVWVTREIGDNGGRLVKQTGDGHLAMFDRPGDAVRTARAIARRVHVFDVEMRCGVHVGEIEIRPGGDIGGIAVHTAARVMDAAEPGAVFVSRTVADLIAGSAVRLEDRGVHELRGVPGSWQLFEVAD